MLLSKFKNSYRSMIQENKFYRIIILLLIISNICLILMVYNKKVITVLVPPVLNEKAEITYNNAAESYKKSWGLFFATMLGNVTPKNIKFVIESIGEFLSPEIYQEIINILYKQAKEISEKEISIYFTPKAIIYDKESDTIFVKGTSKIQAPYGKPQSFSKTWEMKIRIKNYKPELVFITSYKKRPKEEKHTKKGDK